MTERKNWLQAADGKETIRERRPGDEHALPTAERRTFVAGVDELLALIRRTGLSEGGIVVLAITPEQKNILCQALVGLAYNAEQRQAASTWTLHIRGERRDGEKP